mmetsp:Transcript_9791/g.29373  ORF Transcript_9791/g.29373 Transcript_9791/m.29373 type:complete len:289 (+) Transcript_9791:1994-2860(+)
MAQAMNEDLWGQVLRWLEPTESGSAAGSSRELCAAHGRDGLWLEYAEREPPLWHMVPGLPSRERYRRAVLLDASDELARRVDSLSVNPRSLTTLTVVVGVFQNSDEPFFLARFPFEPRYSESQGGEVALTMSSSDTRHGKINDVKPIVTPQISNLFSGKGFEQENSSPVPSPDCLKIAWCLEQPDGRMAKLVDFEIENLRERDCCSSWDDPYFSLCTWYEKKSADHGERHVEGWQFKLTLDVTFPKPSPLETEGVVASLELTANYEGVEDDSASIEEFKTMLAYLPWH